MELKPDIGLVPNQIKNWNEVFRKDPWNRAPKPRYHAKDTSKKIMYYM